MFIFNLYLQMKDVMLLSKETQWLLQTLLHLFRLVCHCQLILLTQGINQGQTWVTHYLTKFSNNNNYLIPTYINILSIYTCIHQCIHLGLKIRTTNLEKVSVQHLCVYCTLTLHHVIEYTPKRSELSVQYRTHRCCTCKQK